MFSSFSLTLIKHFRAKHFQAAKVATTSIKRLCSLLLQPAWATRTSTTSRLITTQMIRAGASRTTSEKASEDMDSVMEGQHEEDGADVEAVARLHAGLALGRPEAASLRQVQASDHLEASEVDLHQDGDSMGRLLVWAARPPSGDPVVHEALRRLDGTAPRTAHRASTEDTTDHHLSNSRISTDRQG